MLDGDLRLGHGGRTLDFVVPEPKTGYFWLGIPLERANLMFAASGLMIVEHQRLNFLDS
jgi:hypothetical protein